MATRYGRAGGNWSASGTWSATSGGGSDGAGLNAGDDVVLDANSSGSFTIDTSISINSLVCTGFTGTLTHNGVTLTISGNTFTLSSGMTYNAGSSSRVVKFASTSGTTLITSAGKTFGGVTLDGVGGTFQLVDAMSVLAGGVLTLTNGTFDANNQNVTAGFFSSSNANTRVLTMGSGTWTINATAGSVWNCTTSTGLTVNAGTATILISASATGARSVTLGGKSWPAVSLVNSGSLPAYVGFIDAGTLKSLSITAPMYVAFPASATLTITDGFTWAGASFSSMIHVQTNSTSGTAATISSGNNGSISYGAIEGLTFTGGGTFTATNSVDLQGNSGISIGGPSGGGGPIGVIGS